MSGPINRITPGFLSFFGIKNNGTNPEYLVDSVQLTVDLLDWLLGDNINLETLKGTVSVNAVGTSFGDAALVVPQNEAWWVVNYTGNSAAAIGAGQTIQVVLSMNYPAAPSGQIEVLGPPSNVATTGQWLFAGRALPCKPMLLGPGAQPTMNALQLTAGPVSCQQFVRFARMRL